MNLSEINALAEQYAAKYNPDRVAPFPYENVTKQHKDLDIYFLELYEPSEKVSGVILYSDGKYSILVSTLKPEVRQHFTLAHELGHYFLHQDILKEQNGLIDEDDELDGGKLLYRLDDATYDRIEREANHFAASLIMPEELVRKAWAATGSIQDCAKIFKVSTIAMSIRLTELGLVQ